MVLKKADESDIETIKNLTDADKLLRDEYKLLKIDLDDKNDIIAKMQTELQQNFSLINEIKKTVEIKETNLNESLKKEKLINEKLEETSKKVVTLNKKIDEYESAFVQLKNDLVIKKDIEKELQGDNQRLNAKINDFSSQLKEKMSEIEFLNRENVSLQERINADEKRISLIDTEKNDLKQKLANLKTDLDKKSTELNKFDSLVKSKEIELGKTNKLITNKEQAVQKKLEEFEKNKIELSELRTKYDDLRLNLEDKVSILNKEIERLNKDKEQLFQDLNDIKAKHSHCKESTAQLIENEIDHEKAVLQKLENQALNAKYETKIQYLEVEIDTLRSKIKKLLREKETQEQVLKENQQLVKEIALKYASDSDSWNRQKVKLLEKEKLYEESVDMRKELKKAADKLRLKLQSLEEQIIDKQNKHTIEKNTWETQRLQYVTSKNKLEEQLSKLSSLKRSKKEIEFAWDKERRDLNVHVESLEASIKDLQLQLNQRNATMAQIGDQYAQNEKIQSLFGENEFLKNRIKEVNILLKL
jgi:chromosome segregation ATPase